MPSFSMPLASGKGKKKPPNEQDIQHEIVSRGAQALYSPNRALQEAQKAGSNGTLQTFSQQDRDAFFTSVGWSLVTISQTTPMKVQRSSEDIIFCQAKQCSICDADVTKCPNYWSETP